MDTLIKYLAYFFIYSFLGWICETIYCSIGEKKFVNRGFLNGPICPIYGVGALIVTKVLGPFKDNALLVFLFGMLLTSLLEYVTSVILEVLFHTKWWDYSERKFNIHGRVCLLNSTLFGIMCLVVIELINPIIVSLVLDFPKVILTIIVSIISIIFILDLSVTVFALLKINGKLQQITHFINELKAIGEEPQRFNEEELRKLFNKLRKEEKFCSNEKIDKLVENLRNIKNKSTLQRRLFKAFPGATHKKYSEQFKKLKQLLKEKSNK
ncbi:putative ABC transporter permease [Clostridium tarantellae]|uniref:ABC transporter permease n=1 Tax=Clostridium tarantellae TaxID=39493 RepID=A0A6I1MQD1_9CLOT|nr:putative ABC transporter permease [Clostridium tarantellae]MPQ45023.1 hypothetical protein [Clostridium tarantellae]